MTQSILDSIRLEDSENGSSNIELEFYNTVIPHCPLPGHNENSIAKDIDTGFSSDNSLNLKPCSTSLKLNTPLFKENYLSEFKTEDEKRTARRNLGLYDEHDVVGMSLLTTGKPLATETSLDSMEVKTIELGKIPFAVQTLAKAVMVKEDSGYKDLQSIITEERSLVNDLLNTFKLLNVENPRGSLILSVVDMRKFLTGYNNGITLKLVINQALDNTLKFETKGTINTEWQ